MTDQQRLTEALASSYTIDHELGRGGMTAVYLAEDLKHQRQVAIKVLHPNLATRREMVRWLEAARRPETRERRLELALERLEADRLRED